MSDKSQLNATPPESAPGWADLWQSFSESSKQMAEAWSSSMAPFMLGDFVGLDTTFILPTSCSTIRRVQRERMVMAGLYGRKSGRGFYDYSDAANPRPMDLH